MRRSPSASTAIAYPGLTANFDVAKSAALAITLLDWREFGRAYAQTMRDCARALAAVLSTAPAFRFSRAIAAITTSHQFAIEAARYGGGQTAAKLLRRANLLTCGIGLPGAAGAGRSERPANRHARNRALGNDACPHGRAGCVDRRQPCPAAHAPESLAARRHRLSQAVQHLAICPIAAAIHIYMSRPPDRSLQS